MTINQQGCDARLSRGCSELQLDALRELANISCGGAATALSQMIGCSVDLTVPSAAMLSLADAVDSLGPPDAVAHGVVVPVNGSIDALILLLFGLADAAALCDLLGVDADSEVGQSALSEIGNILAASCLTALTTMTGLTLEPCPPLLATDMVGAMVASLLATTVGEAGVALVLDTQLVLQGRACSLQLLLLPSTDAIDALLAPLGIA